MSATKSTRGWVKSASLAELFSQRTSLAGVRDREKNGMVRASLSQRVEIIDAEIKRREPVCPLCREALEPDDRTDVGGYGVCHHHCPDTLA